MEVTKKLVSRKGTLLGTITYPAEWERDRARKGADGYARGYIRLMMWEPWKAFSVAPLADTPPAVLTFSICEAWSRDYPDAVQLEGITPEQFEQQPRCSFAPGAGYLRSLMAG
jgi:hypothetical protein